MLFVLKKWPIRPALQISHHLNFVCSTLKHVRRQQQKLNYRRKGSERNLEKGETMVVQRGAISAFRGAIVTFLEIVGRFYLSKGRFHTCQYCN